jgi:hypothetical protein
LFAHNPHRRQDEAAPEPLEQGHSFIEKEECPDRRKGCDCEQEHIVLHIRYTARDGGQLLAQKSKENWKKVVADAESAPLSRLFGLKQEFPSEWYRWQTRSDANGERVSLISLNTDRFPMLFKRRALHFGQIDLFGLPAKGKQPTKIPNLRQPDDTVVQFSSAPPVGPLIHTSAIVDVNAKDAEEESTWRFSVAPIDAAESIEQLDDLFVLCQYDVKPKTS